MEWKHGLVYKWITIFFQAQNYRKLIDFYVDLAETFNVVKPPTTAVFLIRCVVPLLLDFIFAFSLGLPSRDLYPKTRGRWRGEACALMPSSEPKTVPTSGRSPGSGTEPRAFTHTNISISWCARLHYYIGRYIRNVVHVWTIRVISLIPWLLYHVINV